MSKQKVSKEVDDYGVETFETKDQPKTKKEESGVKTLEPKDQNKTTQNNNVDAPVQLDEDLIYEQSEKVVVGEKVAATKVV